MPNSPINNLIVQEAGVALSGLLVGNGATAVSSALQADISSALDLIGGTQGNLLYRSGTGWTVLAPGTAGQVLTTNGAAANPSWSAAGSGDVTGPAGATANGLARYSGTTGKILKDSMVVVSDLGAVQFSAYGIGVIQSDASGNLTSAAVGAAVGGTGQTSYAVGDLLYASSTTALSKLAAVAVGQVLISQGVGTAPIWSASAILSGSLTFSGLGSRFMADFSNATVANRLLFQTTTTNGPTAIIAIPNGSGTNSAFRLYDSSDVTNAGIFDMASTGAANLIRSYQIGSGVTRNIELSIALSTIVTISSSGLVATGSVSASSYMKPGGVFVSALPLASTAGAGAVMLVTNATNAAGTGLGTPPTGGGSVNRMVYSDGALWLLM